MRFYLSHSIRGKYGKDATQVQMKENCDKAILLANTIRKIIPSIELYVPAEHEDFVELAYHHGYLTEKQLLEIDCLIINDCEGVITHIPEGDELQGGRLVEYNHTVKQNKPIYLFADVGQVIEYLARYIMRA